MLIFDFLEKFPGIVSEWYFITYFENEKRF